MGTGSQRTPKSAATRGEDDPTTSQPKPASITPTLNATVPLQEDDWHDWLLWTRAGLEHGVTDRAGAKKVIAMLEADKGEFLSFAMVTARKNTPTP